MEIKDERIYPMLLNGVNVVSYRELRRVHGDKGAAIWARAVAEGATLPNDYVRWSWYSHYMNKQSKQNA